MRTAAVLILLVTIAHPVAGQVPGLLQPNPAPAAQPEPARDPLGRDTPRGTITTFVMAVHREDFETAARCLQVKSPEGGRAKVETLARDLTGLMDRYFGQGITSISGEPAGDVNDGLPLDKERAGTMRIGGSHVDIMLVRVKDPDYGYIWLISSETLSKVPALHDAVQATWFERMVPATLENHSFLGLSWAHWIALVLCFAVPLLLLWPAAGLVRVVVRKIVREPERRRRVDDWYRELRMPVVIALAFLIQLGVMPLFGFPLQFRIVYGRIALIAAVVVFTWLMRRLLRLVCVRAQEAMTGVEHAGTRSLIVLAERGLSVVIVMVAIFSILTILGADTRAALAGVGIGGVAVALGAQKSVEDLLGAVFLLTDKALAVGDSCTISNRDGTVEDITLRSVRLRTTEQSLLSIPAGVLAKGGIENFSTRRKILMQTTLRLRYGTSAAQLRLILERMHGLLSGDSRLEAGTSRVRLADFGERAVEIQVFAYVATGNFATFLEVREGLLLQIAEVIESSGSAFAQPTEFVYLDGPPAAMPDRHEPDDPRDAGRHGVVGH